MNFFLVKGAPEGSMQPASFGESLGNYFTMFLSASIVFEILTLAFAAVCMAGSFQKNRKSVLIHIGYFFAISALALVTGMFGYAIAALFANSSFMGPTIVLFLCLPGVLFLAFFSKGNPWHRALRATFYLSICYLVTEVAHNYNLLLDEFVEFGSALASFLFCLPYLLLIPVALQSSRLKIHHMVHFRKTVTIQYILVFATVFATALLSGFLPTDENTIRVFMMLILLLLGMVDILAYASHYYTSKRERTILDLEARAQLNEAASTMLKLNEQDIARNTRVRHDLKNTLAYLREAIEQGRYEEALTFIDETAGKSVGDLKIVDCGNRIVSSIMNLELRKAKLNSVEVRYRLIVPPELSIPDSDLCSLLTNILDNAIEGTLASGKPGYVDFSLVANQGLLRIQSKNPTKLFAVPMLSTKKEVGHGHGTSIIKSIVKEYGGYYEFAVKEHMFTLDCVLNMNMHPEDHNA